MRHVLQYFMVEVCCRENAARTSEGATLVAKLPADLEQMECDLMVIEEDAVSLLHSMVRCPVPSSLVSNLESKLQMLAQRACALCRNHNNIVYHDRPYPPSCSNLPFQFPAVCQKGCSLARRSC